MFYLSSLHNRVFLCPLTFSGQFKGNDRSALFERSRLSIRCLNVHGNAVKDGLAQRKIHSLPGIKLMLDHCDQTLRRNTQENHRYCKTYHNKYDLFYFVLFSRTTPLPNIGLWTLSPRFLSGFPSP